DRVAPPVVTEPVEDLGDAPEIDRRLEEGRHVHGGPFYSRARVSLAGRSEGGERARAGCVRYLAAAVAFCFDSTPWHPVAHLSPTRSSVVLRSRRARRTPLASRPRGRSRSRPGSASRWRSRGATPR